MVRSLFSSLFLSTWIIFGYSDAAVAAELPGEAPKTLAPTARPSGKRPLTAPLSASGLKVFYENYGRFRVVNGAAGSNDGSHTLRIAKPNATSVVEKAFLMAASNWTVPISNGDVAIDGNVLTWVEAVTNDLGSYTDFFHSVRADVTSLVAGKINSASPGAVDFTITEINNANYIDGEVLVVVFRDPSLPSAASVSLLFGGQNLSGDRFELTLAKPFDKAKKNQYAYMGLGISYGYQENGTQQYSIVNVNGKRLSTSAGGEDDGQPANGALITVGGYGDKAANPPPMALPKEARSDDEFYILTPYIKTGDKVIRVDTSNPSNDDNIFYAWFNLSADADVNKDTDGDGLLDSWEKYGYDHNGDGKIDVNLPRLGADPLKKDIFVGYSWMAASKAENGVSHRPSIAVLKAVVDAFAAAPVSNPNGTKGINLHFVSRGSVPHDVDLNPVWDEFDALMDPKFTRAERVVFHRMLCAHGFDRSGHSGLSRSLPGSDFIETLGTWPTNPGTFKQRAGTIMHELGHNLGLRHGGVDHENHKPNHLSVMNYFYQVNWLTKDGHALLDFERHNLSALDENALSEGAGLDRVGIETPLKAYGVRWKTGGEPRYKASGANENIDWNTNGNATETGLSVDIDDSGANGVLAAGYIEWNNLVFNGGSIGGSSSAASKANEITAPRDLIELSWDDVVRLRTKQDK